MKTNIPSIVTENLSTNFFCKLYNACLNKQSKRVKKLVSSIIEIDDFYVMDVWLDNPLKLNINMFGFDETLPTDIQNFCNWLGCSGLKVEIMYYCYVKSITTENNNS